MHQLHIDEGTMLTVILHINILVTSFPMKIHLQIYEETIRKSVNIQNILKHLIYNAPFCMKHAYF